MPQRSEKLVTKSGEEISVQVKGRHDPVIVPRAVVVVEAMAAITLTDALFLQYVCTHGRRLWLLSQKTIELKTAPADTVDK